MDIFVIVYKIKFLSNCFDVVHHENLIPKIYGNILKMHLSDESLSQASGELLSTKW